MWTSGTPCTTFGRTDWRTTLETIWHYLVRLRFTSCNPGICLLVCEKLFHMCTRKHVKVFREALFFHHHHHRRHQDTNQMSINGMSKQTTVYSQHRRDYGFTYYYIEIICNNPLVHQISTFRPDASLCVLPSCSANDNDLF